LMKLRFSEFARQTPGIKTPIERRAFSFYAGSWGFWRFSLKAILAVPFLGGTELRHCDSSPSEQTSSVPEGRVGAQPD